ncbi:MAG: ornithine carbamoyltransferase [Bacilli bacterium]
MKHLISMSDLSAQEINYILNKADQLKYEQQNGIESHCLKNQNLGMIFEKASTRTRVSFEVGINQLGGKGLFLSSNDLQLARGESIKDTSIVLSSYLDLIMIRTFKQAMIEEMALYSKVPVINGLSNEEHPMQILTDLLTIKEIKKSFENITIAYIGDGNNMANSLIIACHTLGINLNIATPLDYKPAITLPYNYFESPEQAVKDVDVIMVDVFTSMGDEASANARNIAFQGYQLNSELLSLAHDDAIVLHCLPAHLDEEISSEVFNQFQDVIYEEAANRLHIAKAVMIFLSEHAKDF